MRLLVITPEPFIAHEIAWIHRLFQMGLDCLHVRKPQATETELRTFIQQIDPVYHPRVMVHRYVALYHEFGLRGFHWKPSTPAREKAPSIEGVLSCSAHSRQEIEALDAPHREIFISPVFDSLSKRGYPATQGLLDLGAMPRKSNLIALGGVSAENIRQVQQAGFEGAALLGYCWQSADPVAPYLLVKKTLEEV